MAQATRTQIMDADANRDKTYTQSVALTQVEFDIVKAAAAKKRLSTSAWAFGCISRAMSSKTAQLSAKSDVVEIGRRLTKTKDRTKRISVVMKHIDMVGWKVLADNCDVTPHALSQGVLVCDAERELGGLGRRAPKPKTVETVETALPADVAAMLDALDNGCWPNRETTDLSGVAYGVALAARAKVRTGMLRMIEHTGRDRTDVELIATALVDHPTTRDVAAMLCLPLAEVARAVALRCLLSRERREAEARLTSAEAERANAEEPDDFQPPAFLRGA